MCGVLHEGEKPPGNLIVCQFLILSLERLRLSCFHDLTGFLFSCPLIQRRISQCVWQLYQMDFSKFFSFVLKHDSGN